MRRSYLTDLIGSVSIMALMLSVVGIITIIYLFILNLISDYVPTFSLWAFIKTILVGALSVYLIYWSKILTRPR